MLTVENFENIPLCMRLLFEFQCVKCHLDVFLSRRRGPDEAPNNSDSDLFSYRNALAGCVLRKFLELLSADVGNSYA